MRKGGWSFYDQRMRWVHEEKYFIHISEESSPIPLAETTSS